MSFLNDMKMPQLNSGRMIRTALAVSVALNLLVVGVGVGAMFHNDEAGRDEMGRDLGFGPFAEALRPEDRRALRKSLMQKSPEIRAAMALRRADMTALLAALRAVPFDGAALNGALDGMRLRLEGQLKLGHQALGDVLAAMPEAERLQVADRLERGLRRMGKKDGGVEKSE